MRVVLPARGGPVSKQTRFILDGWLFFSGASGGGSGGFPSVLGFLLLLAVLDEGVSLSFIHISNLPYFLKNSKYSVKKI
jgi:hypothetical protein